MVENFLVRHHYQSLSQDCQPLSHLRLRFLLMDHDILKTKQFAFLSSYAFLSLLSSTPKTVPTGLELALKDAEQFRQLLLGESKFTNAMRLCRKHGQTSHFNEDEE
jgi:hypothetical protein